MLDRQDADNILPQNDTDPDPDRGWKVSIQFTVAYDLDEEVMGLIGNAIKALQTDGLFRVTCHFDPHSY
jgi:hypothetical protein